MKLAVTSNLTPKGRGEIKLPLSGVFSFATVVCTLFDVGGRRALALFFKPLKYFLWLAPLKPEIHRPSPLSPDPPVQKASCHNSRDLLQSRNKLLKPRCQVLWRGCVCASGWISFVQTNVSSAHRPPPHVSVGIIPVSCVPECFFFKDSKQLY